MHAKDNNLDHGNSSEFISLQVRFMLEGDIFRGAREDVALVGLPLHAPL